jgi:DNA-binding MarR family transcriptional regulator
MARGGERRDKLDDEISLGIQGVIAHAVLTNERIARAVGLNVVDLQTLGVIARAGGPMTPGAVSAATELPSSTTTRVLDRLAAGDFIERYADSTDRRKVLVTANYARLQSMQHHYAGIIDNMKALHDQFTLDELDVVARYLAVTNEQAAGRSAAPSAGFDKLNQQ